MRFAVLFVLATSVACSVTRNVRPLGEGKWAAGLSAGGPFFTNLGGAIPTPLVSVYGRRGLDAKTDLDFGLHVPIVSNLGVDAGAARLLLEQDGRRPAVMAGGRLYLHANLLWFSGTNPNGRPYDLGLRVFEEAYVTASWRLHDRVLAWVGFDLFMQLETLGRDDVSTFHPVVLAGAEWRAAKRFGLALEVKQLSFTNNQRFAAVDFLGPADYGAFALQLGFNFYPGAE